jgi:hypothetical protein
MEMEDMTTDLATLETQIHVLSPDAPVGDIGAARYAVDFLIRRAKELKDALDEKMIEKIDLTGQPIVIGPVVYTIGDPPVTKCLDLRGTLEALFEACEGEWARSRRAWRRTGGSTGRAGRCCRRRSTASYSRRRGRRSWSKVPR